MIGTWVGTWRWSLCCTGSAPSGDQWGVSCVEIMSVEIPHYPEIQNITIISQIYQFTTILEYVPVQRTPHNQITELCSAWPCTLSWSTPPDRWPPPHGRIFCWPPPSTCLPSGGWFLRGPWRNSSSLTGSLSVSPHCLPLLCSYEGLSYRHIKMLKLIMCIISVKLNNYMLRI